MKKDFYIEYYRLDSSGNYHGILGTEYKRIFKDCTLKKIYNYLNRISKSLLDGRISEINIYSYTNIYDEQSHLLERRVLVVG